MRKLGAKIMMLSFLWVVLSFLAFSSQGPVALYVIALPVPAVGVWSLVSGQTLSRDLTICKRLSEPFWYWVLTISYFVMSVAFYTVITSLVFRSKAN